MSTAELITTAIVKNIFTEEISILGGRVSDTFDDGRHLFLRSILPEVKEVGVGDRMQAGVALRTNGPDLLVHPYVFRQVCSNGAIIAHTIQTHRVVEIDVRTSADVTPELREAIQACGASEAFAATIEQVRSAQGREADLALSLMPLFSRFPSSVTMQIMRQFFADGDKSTFGLMNAVTATARDTADPQVRWDLEELGGGVIADLPTRSPQLSGSARRRRQAVALEPATV